MKSALPQCPHCDAIDLRRNGRSGFLQERIFSRLGYFPWECGQCRHVYLLKLRSPAELFVAAESSRAARMSRPLLKAQP